MCLQLFWQCLLIATVLVAKVHSAPVKSFSKRDQCHLRTPTSVLSHQLHSHFVKQHLVNITDRKKLRLLWLSPSSMNVHHDQQIIKMHFWTTMLILTQKWNCMLLSLLIQFLMLNECLGSVVHPRHVAFPLIILVYPLILDQISSIVHEWSVIARPLCFDVELFIITTTYHLYHSL